MIDGGVNGAGWLTRFSGEVSRYWDSWVIDGLVNVIGYAVKFLSYPARIIQTGIVQTYAWLITLGVLLSWPITCCISNGRESSSG